MTNSILEKYKKSFGESLNSKNYTQFLHLELNFYETYIKNVETVDNYNNGFCVLSSFMINYAESVINEIATDINPPERKICFFIFSLDNDLAHIEFLSEILHNRNQNDLPEIYIAGHSKNLEIKSILLQKLAIENKIKIINIQFNHESLIDFLNFFIKNNISKLLVYSVPLHLDFFIRILGRESVYWLSSRLELNCFENLKYKISFTNEKKLNNENDNWLRLPASLPMNYKYDWHTKLQSKNFQALTIARSEKISQPHFMSCIKDILLEHENVHFSYASNRKCEIFEKYISNFQLNNRISFLGWVDPGLVINNFDIYLDTPQSGLVAAGAFASGMPTVFYRNSNSFLEAYEKSISKLTSEENPNLIFRILDLLSNNNYEYINNFKKSLETDINLYNLQKKIANKFFYNSIDVYSALINVIEES